MVENKFGEGGGVMEITLDQGPDDEMGQEPKRINHEYVQRTIKGITRSFVMYDDSYINHSLSIANPKAFALNFFKSKDKEQHHVNLAYLDPKPDRQVHIAWEWFVNGLAAIAWAFVIIYVGEYTDFTMAHDAMLPAGILLGTFGIIAFMIFYYKTQDKIIYKSCIGQVPVIELFHMPRSDAYNKFIDTFEASIYKAQHKGRMSMKHRLAGELKLLRKMAESGSISDNEYESARGEIFKHKEYSV
jgi:hypothetical protein